MPCVLGRDGVGERGHRRSVQAGEERAVQVLVARAALAVRAGGEVERGDVEPPVVEERRHRRSVPLARLPVAIEAGLRIPDLLPLLARSRVVSRLAHVLDRLARALLLPARRERLDVLDHVSQLPIAQHLPGRHVRVVEAFVQRAHQVVVDRKRSARRRTALEDRAGEVPRTGVEPLGGIAAPVALLAVAGDAVPLVDGLAAAGARGVRRTRWSRSLCEGQRGRQGRDEQDRLPAVHGIVSLECEIEPEQARVGDWRGAIAGVEPEPAELEVQRGLGTARQLEGVADDRRSGPHVPRRRTSEGGFYALAGLDELVPYHHAPAAIDRPDSLEEAADEGGIAHADWST